MPQMASITVKNAANEDKIFVAASPSAGDKSPAVWRENAASGIIGHRPQFTVTTRDNGRLNGRHLTMSYRGPIVTTNSVTGVQAVQAVVPGTLEMTLPTNIDAAAVLDHFVKMSNLFASALSRSVAEEGYAPT